MIVKINGENYEALSIQPRAKDSAWDNRESRAITLEMTYAEAMALFVNDITWSTESTYMNEEGVENTIVADFSEFALAGPVTDNRDGTITVKMGKYLPDELMLIPLAESPKDHKQATVWRNAIETAMQTIEDDQVALAAAPLYPLWEVLVAANTAVEAGFRFYHEGRLYKAVSAHTLSPEWVPGNGTESLYYRIDEAHTGTLEDPIPYDGNMALTAGLYYSQNGMIYLCDRDTGVPVYNALNDLVGIYVQVVS